MIETKKSFCRFCHASCGIEVDVDTEQQRVLAVRGDRDNPYSLGYTCAKGRAIPEAFHHPERLLSCKKRVEGGWIDISSAQAFDEIGAKLVCLRERYGPRSISAYVGCGAGYASTGVPLTKAWLDAIGSPSFYTALTIDCPCIVVGAHRFFGTVATPFGMYGGASDLAHADVTMLIGTNPAASHAVWIGGGSYPGKRLRDARARGMKLIVVDPRRSDFARQADLHLPIRPGEDATLLAGMIKIIFERRLFDREYTDTYVSGLDQLQEAVRDFDLEYVSRRTALSPELVTQATEMFATAKTGAARQGIGINMSRHQNLNTHLVYTLNALCGRIDRPGGLMCNPGVFTNTLASREPVLLPLFGEARSRVRGLRGLVVGPQWVEMPTATLADEILTPGEGRIRSLIVHGGNPVAVFPDQDKIVRALKELELLVVIDPFVTESAKFAHYLLAPRYFLERPDVTLALEGNLDVPFGHYTAPVLQGPGDLVDEWQIGWELAKRMGAQLQIPGISMDRKPTSDAVIAALTAHGRIPLEEVKRYPSGHIFGDLVAGAVLPHQVAHLDRKLAAGHPDALAELREMRAEPVLATAGYTEGETFSFRLITTRVLEFQHSLGQNLPSLREKHPCNPAYMHPRDLEALGVRDGDLVEIDSGYGRTYAVVTGSTDVTAGVVAMTHGWGVAAEHEQDVRAQGSSVGRLIPDAALFDRVTGMPLMSALPVNVRAAVR